MTRFEFLFCRFSNAQDRTAESRAARGLCAMQLKGRYHTSMGFGGFGDMMFILILGLLLFGPKKLPEIARQVGKVLGDFKRASAEFQAQLNDEVRKLESSISDSENNTNSIASPYLQGTAARNSAPQYALEPNSGQHEGDIPSSAVSLGDETPPPSAEAPI